MAARNGVQHVVIVQIMSASTVWHCAIIASRTLNVRNWSLCSDGAHVGYCKGKRQIQNEFFLKNRE